MMKAIAYIFSMAIFPCFLATHTFADSAQTEAAKSNHSATPTFIETGEHSTDLTKPAFVQIGTDSVSKIEQNLVITEGGFTSVAEQIATPQSANQTTLPDIPKPTIQPSTHKSQNNSSQQKTRQKQEKPVKTKPSKSQEQKSLKKTQQKNQTQSTEKKSHQNTNQKQKKIKPDTQEKTPTKTKTSPKTEPQQKKKKQEKEKPKKIEKKKTEKKTATENSTPTEDQPKETIQPFNIEQSVIKVALWEGASPKEAEKLILSKGVDIDLTLASRQRISESLRKHDIKNPHYFEIFQFCTPEEIRKIVDVDIIYSVYMPCQISLVEDNKGRLWLITLNLDIVIQDRPLPSDIFQILIKTNKKLMTIMSAAATGKF